MRTRSARRPPATRTRSSIPAHRARAAARSAAKDRRGGASRASVRRAAPTLTEDSATRTSHGARAPRVERRVGARLRGRARVPRQGARPGRGRGPVEGRAVGAVGRSPRAGGQPLLGPGARARRRPVEAGREEEPVAPGLEAERAALGLAGDLAARGVHPHAREPVGARRAAGVDEHAGRARPREAQAQHRHARRGGDLGPDRAARPGIERDPVVARPGALVAVVEAREVPGPQVAGARLVRGDVDGRRRRDERDVAEAGAPGAAEVRQREPADEVVAGAVAAGEVRRRRRRVGPGLDHAEGQRRGRGRRARPTAGPVVRGVLVGADERVGVAGERPGRRGDGRRGGHGGRGDARGGRGRARGGGAPRDAIAGPP